MIARAEHDFEPSLPPSYLFRAFLLQYNLILLGGALLFSLASASVLPLLSGVGLEVLWLGIAPNVPALRRFLDRREPEPEPEASSVPPEPIRPALEPLYANRAGLIERALADLRELAARLDASSQRHVQIGLEAIGRSFLGLCENHQRLSKYLVATPEAGLREEIERMKREFSAEKDLGLRLAIRQSIALAQRRIEQRGQLELSLKTASVRLVTFERAVAALHAQGQALGMKQELMAEIDALRHELGSDPIEPEVIPKPFAPLGA